MDVRIFLAILIFGVLIEPNISQYYGNNYYPNMRAPMGMQMPAQAQMAPQPQQMSMPEPVQGPYNSNEYEDDEQPRFRERNFERRLKYPSQHESDCDDEDGGEHAAPPRPRPQPPQPPPPPNLVLIPYPYALVVPNIQNLNLTTEKLAKRTREETTKVSTTTKSTTTTTTARSTTTTKITTTTTTTTEKPTTKKPIGRNLINYRLEDRKPDGIRLEDRGPEGSRLEGRRPDDARLDIRRPEGARLDIRRPEGPRLEDLNYMRPLKKTKPNWVQKYGIVPIPDNLAEKLLSQMRDVKTLQPNTRRMISRYGQYGLI